MKHLKTFESHNRKKAKSNGIDKSKFDGLEQVASDFMPFDVLQAKHDPQVYGVYLLFIQFKKDKSYGLCIYDTNRKTFIEEPSDLEDYNTSLEKLKNKYGFDPSSDSQYV